MKVKALTRTGENLRIIDQTKLPLETVYLELSSVEEVIEALRTLRVRGAPAIGIAAAYGMAIGVSRSEKIDEKSVLDTAHRLKSARPTAVNLFWAVDRMVECYMGCGTNDSKLVAEILWSEAERIHEEDRQMCHRIGLHGSSLIERGETILTHCNAGALATGGIGTALGVIYTCRDQGKKNCVYVDETRPLLQGARLTAWELRQEGIDCTLICDSVAGMLMRQGRIQRVVVGADRIAANGDTANKIGTYSLAVLAREHKVPFYVAAPSTTFDHDTACGDDIPIEERAGEEVTRGFGKVTAPESVRVYSPAFDTTPNELITAFITEKGIMPGGRGD